jgi:hypothetical protein
VTFFLAKFHQGPVDDDPREPGGKLGVTSECLDVEVRLQVGLLQRIFSLGIVLQNGAGYSEQAAVISPHHDLERRVIGGTYSAREGSVVVGRADSRRCN